MSRDYSKRPDIPKEQFFDYVKGKKIRRNNWNAHAGYFVPRANNAYGLFGEQCVKDKNKEDSWHVLNGFGDASGDVWWELVDPVETPKLEGKTISELIKEYALNFPFKVVKVRSSGDHEIWAVGSTLTVLSDLKDGRFTTKEKPTDPKYTASVKDTPSWKLASFVLREGGYYKNREGQVIGPLQRNSTGSRDTYPFVEHETSYTVDGRYSKAGTSAHLDLIEEVPTPESKQEHYEKQVEALAEEMCRPGSTGIGVSSPKYSLEQLERYQKRLQGMQDFINEDLTTETKKDKTTKKEKSMKEKIVAKAQQIRETIRPYDNYLLAVAALIVIDHFLLKGKYRDKIMQLVTRLADRCSAMLDKLIDKIGG